MEKKNEQSSGSISFTKLLPFLSLSFKRELAKDINIVKKHFVLHSDTAYETFRKVIESDLKSNKKYISQLSDETTKTIIEESRKRWSDRRIFNIFKK